MELSEAYVLIGIVMVVLILVLVAVSVYFIIIYKKKDSTKKKKQQRTHNRQAASPAGNYFQAGTFRLPGKQATPNVYDNPRLEAGGGRGGAAPIEEPGTSHYQAQPVRENQYYNIINARVAGENKDKSSSSSDSSSDSSSKSSSSSTSSDKDSGKGTGSMAGSEHDVSNDVTHDDDDVTNDDSDVTTTDNASTCSSSRIAHVEEVGAPIERTTDPEFVNREKEKIKSRAEQTSVTHGRAYATKYRRRTEPMEPLFEFGEEGEEDRRKTSFKSTKEVYNY